MSNKWTSVKDKLPPRLKDDDSYSIYVLLTDGTSISTGYLEFEEDDEDGNCWVADAIDLINPCCAGWAQPTHWMPLPGLPNEGKE